MVFCKKNSRIGKIVMAFAASAAMVGGLSFGVPQAHAGGVYTAALMNMVLPNTVMHDVPMRDAMQYLRNMTGANIVVNWNVLEAAGISNITPITLNLRNVSMRKIVSVMLREASPNASLVDYVDQNVLMITTRQEANTHLVTRLYPVGDLVMVVPNFTAPSFNLQNQSSNSGVQITSGSSGGANAGNSSNIFSSSGNASAASTVETTDQRAKALVNLIEGTVQPNIWTANGGPATVVYFNRELVISAPIYIQQLISDNQ